MRYILVNTVSALRIEIKDAYIKSLSLCLFVSYLVCNLNKIYFFLAKTMAAPTTLNGLLSVSAGNATTALTSTPNTVVQTPSEPIFLQTKLAQGIAGIFVFAALFLTCQQVN